jgi:hypothetical protein
MTWPSKTTCRAKTSAISTSLLGSLADCHQPQQQPYLSSLKLSGQCGVVLVDSLDALSPALTVLLDVVILGLGIAMQMREGLDLYDHGMQNSS